MAIQTKIMNSTPEVPGLSRTSDLPTKIWEQSLSQTSKAADCFVNQRFSGKLQAFLIGYVGSVITNRSIYGA